MQTPPSTPPKVLEWGAYLGAALIGVWPALGNSRAIGDGVDMYGTMWFYWWIKRCLIRLDNPGFTDLFFYPLGKDIFAHTGNNFVDAVVAAPLVQLFGIPGFSPVFVALILLLNALSFRVFARGVLGVGWAAFGATLAWELNPFTLFELTCGRYTQAFLPFLPLALHQLRACERPGWRAPLLTGLFFALTGWSYWFNGWFLAFAAVGIGALSLRDSPDRLRLLARYAMAALVCVALVAPPVLAMALAAGRGEVPGVTQVEVRSLFVPPNQLGNNVESSLHGLVLMETRGAPMLTHPAWASLALVWLIWGRQRAWGLAAAAVPLFLCMGPVLELPGLPPKVMPHYMAAYHYLPFFDRLWFPYRMVVIPMLVLCLGFGTLLARALEARPLRPAWILAPILGFATWTGLEQRSWSIYPFVTRELHPPETFLWLARQPEGAIIHLPFGITQPAIVWQTFHDKPLFGGMGENASLLWPEGFKQRMKNSFIRALLQAVREPEKQSKVVETQKQKVIKEGFRWVVLHRDLVESDVPNRAFGQTLSEEQVAATGLDATRALVGLLGEPAAVEGPLVTWDLVGGAEVPLSLTPSEHSLYTRTWSRDPMPEYEQALKRKGRLVASP